MDTSRFEIGSWIGLSIVSSTSLILVLKQVGKLVKCKYTTTLSTFHFLSTWLILEFIALIGKIRRCDQVPLSKRIILSFLVCTSIVSMNFNLGANSIGFYQMSKLVCIPYMVLHKFFVQKQRFSMSEIFSLAILLLGVALFSVSDVEFNIKGTIYAIIAILSTTYNQLMTEDLQKAYSINGPELQLSIAPTEFAIGCVAATVLEGTGEDSFMSSRFSIDAIVYMLLTCVFAVGVNIATFGLIGKTSSVTYQVVGHFKTVLLLVLGYVFFPSKWESKSQMIRAISGIIVALIGVFSYSKVKMNASKKPNEELMPLISDKK